MGGIEGAPGPSRPAASRMMSPPGCSATKSVAGPGLRGEGPNWETFLFKGEGAGKKKRVRKPPAQKGISTMVANLGEIKFDYEKRNQIQNSLSLKSVAVIHPNVRVKGEGNGKEEKSTSEDPPNPSRRTVSAICSKMLKIRNQLCKLSFKSFSAD